MKKGRVRKLRRGLWLVAGLFGAVGLGVCAIAWATHDSSPVGHFRSEEGKRAYTEAYDDAMERLPEPTRTMDVKTDYGTVRVYEFSSEETRSTTPVVLMPGYVSGVPMWEENLSGLAEERTVYALDSLGDAGMSVQTKKIEDAGDQALWVDQTLAQLGLERVHITGHSFGGWYTANYAARHPARVASISVLEPVLVFQGLRWQVYVKSLPAALPFLPESWREAMLSDFGGVEEIDPDDPVARMISAATEHYDDKLPMPPERITEKQLQNLSVPVYVAIASDSAMHDQDAAMQVARENVRDLQIKKWPGTTHSLPMEVPDKLNRELLDFMAAHDPAQA